MRKNVTLGMNAAHHQKGTLSSTIREMASEIQPMLRLLATRGMRSNSRGGSVRTTLSATGAAISALLSFHRRRPVRQERAPLLFRGSRDVLPFQNKLWKSAAYRSNPASQDSDCEREPGKSNAVSCSETQGWYNCARQPSPARLCSGDRRYCQRQLL